MIQVVVDLIWFRFLQCELATELQLSLFEWQNLSVLKRIVVDWLMQHVK
jgi:hypothetical protein